MSALKRKWKHTFQQQRQDHPWWFLVQISVGLWHQLVFSHTWWHPLLPTPKEIVPQLMHDPPFVDVSTISVGKWQMFLPLQVQGQSWESHTTRWRKAFPWDHGSASERIRWMEQSAWWRQACNLFSQIGSQSQKSEAGFFWGKRDKSVLLMPSQMYRDKTKQSKCVMGWITEMVHMSACIYFVWCVKPGNVLR